MRGLKLSLVIMAAVLVTFGVNRMAYAYHSGGVAECIGCHDIHDPKPNTALLKGSDISSTCLNCHNQPDLAPNSYHISTDQTIVNVAGVPPNEETPGGDFGWLRKTYTWSPFGSPTTELGERHGHNIVASDFNYVADVEHTSSPGGSFVASNLACNSCHDNHGKYRRLSDGTIATSGAPIIGSGSYNNSATPAAGQAVGVYRLLRGIGSTVPGGVTFNVNPPVAVAPSTYNRTEAVTDTRVAYGKGMSDWCATCHVDMHSGLNNGKLVHPVDHTLGSTIAGNYNSYIGSGNISGTQATSYDSLISFEENTNDYTVLKSHAVNNGSVTTGPDTTAKVMCLTCHRAHATGWEHMTRWNNDIEMIILDGEWPGTDATSTVAKAAKWAMGRLKAETKRANYDRPETRYATYQRVLCNKCHVKD